MDTGLNESCEEEGGREGGGREGGGREEGRKEEGRVEKGGGEGLREGGNIGTMLDGDKNTLSGESPLNGQSFLSLVATPTEPAL